MRSAPQSWLFAAISLINVIVSSESLGFLAYALDLCFGEHTEEFTRPSQQRLRLDKEKRPFPGSNHPGEEHQKKSVPLSVCWSLNLSMQDEQLVARASRFPPAVRLCLWSGRQACRTPGRSAA